MVKMQSDEEHPEMSSITYTVPGMTCGHCVNAVTEELTGVPGVENVDVDLATKLVVVTGAPLNDEALRAAIEEAGFEPAP
jgi:copper chaperone